MTALLWPAAKPSDACGSSTQIITPPLVRANYRTVAHSAHAIKTTFQHK